MSKEMVQKESRVIKPVSAEGESELLAGPPAEAGAMLDLQHKIGNRAVQRMLAQRDDGSLQLDEATAGRINDARGGGQGLDAGVQEQMGAALGHDLSGVQVHTDTGADMLSRELNAEAFTTGQDVFFRQGAYDPGSGSGRELIAHELTHVVQQGTGAVSSAQGMTVNPPDDAYEQEADSIAQQVAHAEPETSAAGSTGDTAQRQAVPEEEEEVQARAFQRQEVPEEEELQAKAIQRQEMPEEEEIQTKAIQRQEIPEEEELQARAIQRQEMPEEEESIQAKAVQRQEELPEEEL